jgi:hypothetical protein
VAAGPMVVVALTLVLLVVQVGLWFYGRTVVLSAAQHGLEAARVEGGDPRAGSEVAAEFLDHMPGVASGSYEIDVEEEAGEVRVTVRAEPVQVLPILPVPLLRSELSASKEQVVDG